MPDHYQIESCTVSTHRLPDASTPSIHVKPLRCWLFMARTTQVSYRVAGFIFPARRIPAPLPDVVACRGQDSR